MDKLVAHQSFETGNFYNIAVDRSELKNLAKSNPEKAKELADKWEAWVVRAKVKLSRPWKFEVD